MEKAGKNRPKAPRELKTTKVTYDSVTLSFKSEGACDLYLNDELKANGINSGYVVKDLESETEYTAYVKYKDSEDKSNVIKFKTDKYIAVNHVSFVYREANAVPGVKTRLATKLFPGNASDKTLHFKTDKGKVENGYITLDNVGDVAKVQVKSNDTDYNNGPYGFMTVTCVGEVIPLEGIKINPRPAEIQLNDTFTITVDYTPTNTTQRAVTVTSDDEKVIKAVNQSGTWRLEAMAIGECSITIESNYETKVEPQTIIVKVKEREITE